MSTECQKIKKLQKNYFWILNSKIPDSSVTGKNHLWTAAKAHFLVMIQMNDDNKDNIETKTSFGVIFCWTESSSRLSFNRVSSAV